MLKINKQKMKLIDLLKNRQTGMLKTKSLRKILLKITHLKKCLRKELILVKHQKVTNNLISLQLFKMEMCWETFNKNNKTKSWKYHQMQTLENSMNVTSLVTTIEMKRVTSLFWIKMVRLVQFLERKDCI